MWIRRHLLRAAHFVATVHVWRMWRRLRLIATLCGHVVVWRLLWLWRADRLLRRRRWRTIGRRTVWRLVLMLIMMIDGGVVGVVDVVHLIRLIWSL
jgi:hypothetical protein